MDLKIPDKDFVEARMRCVLPEPEKVDLDIPEALLNAGCLWKDDLYGYQPYRRGVGSVLNEKYEMPRLWNLRPHRYENVDEILEVIAKLPLDTENTFWEPQWQEGGKYCQIPQVIKLNSKPFGCYYLKPDKEDNMILDGQIVGKASSGDFAYRGRRITPSGETWNISGRSPERMVFEWKVLYDSSHPTIDYTLQGTLWTRVREDGDRSGGRPSHPDADWGNPNDPNWERPLEFGTVYLIGDDVYGSARMGLKHLGFWGSLDVAINFIEGVEWAYDLAPKPEYLDDVEESASSKTVIETDPIVDAVRVIKERGNSGDFIRSGKPSVRATSKEVGQRVSGKERDEAWKQVKGE